MSQQHFEKLVQSCVYRSASKTPSDSCGWSRTQLLEASRRPEEQITSGQFSDPLTGFPFVKELFTKHWVVQGQNIFLIHCSVMSPQVVLDSPAVCARSQSQTWRGSIQFLRHQEQPPRELHIRPHFQFFEMKSEDFFICHCTVALTPCLIFDFLLFILLIFKCFLSHFLTFSYVVLNALCWFQSF